jgi:hypothetical protein
MADFIASSITSYSKIDLLCLNHILKTTFLKLSDIVTKIFSSKECIKDPND